MAFSRLRYDWLKLLLSANHVASNGCSKSKMETTDKHFTWTDGEINLLLHVVFDYKVGKEGEVVDWDTVKSKYEDHTKKILEKYPENEKDKFPPGSDATRRFDKERIQNKLTRMKLNFRKAVDMGRRCGGGRAVTTFYEQKNKT